MDRYVAQYVAGVVVRAPAFALGTAFFPIGAGLWHPPRLPERPIALVAHVFDAASVAYALGAGGGSERVAGNRTWLGLRRMLATADVPLADCFLTNALMGVKVGRATGPVRAGDAYRDACAAYLRRQLEVVRPRLVGVLGAHAMRVVARAFPEVARVWRPGTTLTALDRATPPRHTVRGVDLGAAGTVDVVALRHPCVWTGAPRDGPARGAAADASVLRRALDASADVRPGPPNARVGRGDRRT